MNLEFWIWNSKLVTLKLRYFHSHYSPFMFNNINISINYANYPILSSIKGKRVNNPFEIPTNYQNPLSKIGTIHLGRVQIAMNCLPKRPNFYVSKLKIRLKMDKLAFGNQFQKSKSSDQNSFFSVQNQNFSFTNPNVQIGEFSNHSTKPQKLQNKTPNFVIQNWELTWNWPKLAKF